MTLAQIEALEKLLAAASKYWAASGRMLRGSDGDYLADFDADRGEEDRGKEEADCALAAAMHKNLPDLLAAARCEIKLRAYVIHYWSCTKAEGTPCTCGLDAILKEEVKP
jgi:hypothetical protein